MVTIPYLSPSLPFPFHIPFSDPDTLGNYLLTSSFSFRLRVQLRHTETLPMPLTLP